MYCIMEGSSLILFMIKNALVYRSIINLRLTVLRFLFILNFFSVNLLFGACLCDDDITKAVNG